MKQAYIGNISVKQSYAFNYDNTTGIKLSKKRITVLLFINI